MDVGEGARAAAGGGGSGGFIQSVVGFSSSSSSATPLFFWLLTVALVAAIHVASAYMSSPSSSSSSEDAEAEKKASRGGFAGEAEADRNDDRVLQMMRSFSFVHASEEDFVESMATYDRAFDDSAPTATASPPPAPSSLSFSFHHQIPEIPREAAVVQEKEQHEREQEKESPIPSGPLACREEHEEEAEETEEVAEEEEEEPKIVPATHNYRFLTERDFRGFVKEPEAMTVRVHLVLRLPDAQSNHRRALATSLPVPRVNAYAPPRLHRRSRSTSSRPSGLNPGRTVQDRKSGLI